MIKTGVLRIPDSLNHLSSEQLGALGDSFGNWLAQAGKPHIRRSRSRIMLVFLLLRHTGAKLGEILTMVPERDIDLAARTIFITDTADIGQTNSPRKIPLPEHAVREIALILNDPQCIAPEAALDLDPGYVRRKFYERAEAAGLPRNLASPRVIRNSRAVEMLRAGAPLLVVQNMLGMPNIEATARFFEIPAKDLEDLKRFYAHKDLSKKTSARNVFVGQVTHIRHGPVLSEVEVATQEGHLVSALITNDSLHNLGLESSALVMATVKAPLVNVAGRNAHFKTSARNSFAGTIVEIHDDGSVAEVVVQITETTQLCALVSSLSLQELGLKKGSQAIAFFKALSVVLTVE